MAFVRLGKRDLNIILRDMGSIIQWSALTYALPIIASLAYQEPLDIIVKYLVVAILSFLGGMLLNGLFKTDQETEMKHALISLGAIWLVYTAIAGLPFMLIHNVSFLHAFFESMSATTTTGLTVVPMLNAMPKSLIFWRSVLSWLGGIGIVVLAMGGLFSTYSRAAKFITAAGREERIRPNLQNAVSEVWFIYVLLTLIGVGLLYFSGMTFFDAVNYSMSAISTTGMDTVESGLIGLHNYWIDLSLIIIMIFGATSFFTHYLILRKRDLTAYAKDKEFHVLLILGALSSLIILPKMVVFYQSDAIGLEYAFFHAVSAITCGGFALENILVIGKWDDFVKLVLIAVMLIGGASGSTAGGIKISRFWIFLKSVYWRVKSTILPSNAFFARKFEGRTVESEEIKEISQFILVWIMLIVLGTLILTLEGAPMGNAFFEVVSAQSNVGISSGLTHAQMPWLSEAMLIVNMWIGRLEIVPLMALLGFALAYRPRPE